MGGVASAVTVMAGVASAIVSLLRFCERTENPTMEALNRRIEKLEKKDREERERKEREEYEKEKREMEAREEKLRNETAAIKTEIRRREENEATMSKKHEKKEADLMRDFDARAAAIERGFAEQLATLQVEREQMEARMQREREDEEKKVMHAEEDLQKLQSDHDRLQAEKDKIEENWRAGIRPTEHITKEEFLAVKERYGYRKNMFHIAIAGVAGAGKSSLLNAFLGIRNNDPSAAATDIVECTDKVTRYEGQPPLVWYDIPGAGTLDKPGWQYFNQQGLYIFDCIIVLFDARFTETDITILRNCQLVEPPIPTFIVRSKSDQHIDNLYKSRMEDEDHDFDAVTMKQQCIDDYVEKTKASVRKNLKKIGLDENQRVYLVSQVNIRAFVTKGQAVEARTGAAVLDEEDLIRDIIATGCARRGQKP